MSDADIEDVISLPLYYAISLTWFAVIVE